MEKVETLDINQAISIDLGTSANLMAGVDTLGNSFLVDSRQSKAMNQLYNKRIANRKKGKERDYWDNICDRITRKRNHQMRDMVNKSARIVINHCLTRGIGTIVVGWNERIKDSANMGKKTINNLFKCLWRSLKLGLVSYAKYMAFAMWRLL